MTDGLQRVAPDLTDDRGAIDHAAISFAEAMGYRNKRLVVHHYASRSLEDYDMKMQRGAGDKARDANFRSTGFIDALRAYDALLPPEYCPKTSQELLWGLLVWFVAWHFMSCTRQFHI